MKCLSVKQPYAQWIVEGRKSLEIRSWRTTYRGPIVICASLRPALSCDSDYYPRGAAVGIANLVDVGPFLPGLEKDACISWLPDHFAWHLTSPVMIQPVPIKGRLGLFRTPEFLRESIVGCGADIPKGGDGAE